MTTPQQAARTTVNTGMAGVVQHSSRAQPAPIRMPGWRQSGLAPLAERRDKAFFAGLRDATPQLQEPDAGAHLVIVFEDAFAFGPALDVYHLISGQLRPTYALCESWWNYQTLAVASLRPYAIRDAARADIILLSIRDSGCPPRLIRDWIDGWASRRTGAEGILVALLSGAGPETPRPTGLEQYLGASAHVAGIDFLAKSYSPEPETNRRTVATASSWVATILSRNKVSETPPVSPCLRDWGINE